MNTKAKTSDQSNDDELLGESGGIVKRKPVSLSEKPGNLLSKEGFALYVGKTPGGIVAMAKAG